MTGDCLCLNLGIECWCTRPGPGGFGYRPHGTMAAVRRHYRHKTPLCRSCQQAQDRHWEDAAAARLRRRREERAARRRDLADAPRAIRGMRQYAGLTQEGLAGLLGVTRLTVMRWETGRRTPRPGMFARVKAVTGAPAGQAAGWDVAA